MEKLWKLLRFLFILEVALAIHEYGHFREMQKRNIEVAEFSLGVGPRIAGWRIGNVDLSIRLVPLMAYVAPTEKGEKQWIKQPLFDRVKISAAGVLNNCMTGLVGVCLLYLLSGRKNQQSFRMTIKNIIYAPVQFIIVGTQYLLNFVTFGAVSVKNPRSFVFDGVSAPTFIDFVELNLLLSLWNVLPIIPLDGGRIFSDLAIFVLPLNVLSLWNKLGIYFLLVLFSFGGTKLRIIKRNSENKS